MISCRVLTRSKSRKLWRHRHRHEGVLRSEVVEVNNSAVDHNVVDPTNVAARINEVAPSNEDKSRIVGMVILHAQVVEVVEHLLLRIGISGSILSSICAKKTSSLLVSLSSRRRDARRMQILCQTKTSARQRRRVLFT
jgi:hypothetical protein